MRILRADAPSKLRAPGDGRYLYLLADPRTAEVRWVGVARFPVLRLRRHCNPEERGTGLDCNPQKAAWIEDLLGEGFLPLMFLLAVAPHDLVLEFEDRLIQRLRAEGAPLLNRTRRAHLAVAYDSWSAPA